MSNSTYVKCVAVINSCTTSEQYKVADKFIELAHRSKQITSDDYWQLSNETIDLRHKLFE